MDPMDIIYLFTAVFKLYFSFFLLYLIYIYGTSDRQREVEMGKQANRYILQYAILPELYLKCI